MYLYKYIVYLIYYAYKHFLLLSYGCNLISIFTAPPLKREYDFILSSNISFYPVIPTVGTVSHVSELVYIRHCTLYYNPVLNNSHVVDYVK